MKNKTRFQEPAAQKNIMTGYFAAIVSAFLFGLMPLFTKIAYAYGSNPHTVSFMRYFYTMIAAFMLLKALPGQPFRVTKRELFCFAVLGVFYACMTLFLYASYSYINSGLATSLHFSYPVMVMVLSVFLLQSRLSRRQVLCAVLCMVGIALMTQAEGGMNLFGFALAVLSGLNLALYVVFVTRFGMKDLPMIKLVFWLSLFTALYLFLFSVLTGKLLIRLPWQAHLAQCMMPLCVTLPAMALYQKGMTLIGGVKTSLLSTLEPIVSAVVGVLVFREVLSTRALCGIVFVLLSAVLLVRE